MTDEAIQPGCILHWDGFKLSDNSEGHKFFVVVGAKPNCNFLAIIATSKKKWNRLYTPGGNHDSGWYHIPGDGKNFFPLDTWLLFSEPQELSAAELMKLSFEKKITIVGKLKPDIANGICNCMRKCQDVSKRHTDLLGPPIAPAKKA